MRLDVVVPDLGEQPDIEIQFSAWLKPVGATLTADEDVAELITDKAAFTLPAPAAGRLVETLVQPGQAVKPGAVIARMDI
ncbi:MAG: biotin/lipoyl-containing protein [Planctomycetota bacterium]